MIRHYYYFLRVQRLLCIRVLSTFAIDSCWQRLAAPHTLPQQPTVYLFGIGSTMPQLSRLVQSRLSTFLTKVLMHVFSYITVEVCNIPWEFITVLPFESFMRLGLWFWSVLNYCVMFCWCTPCGCDLIHMEMLRSMWSMAYYVYRIGEHMNAEWCNAKLLTCNDHGECHSADIARKLTSLPPGSWRHKAQMK